MATTDWNPLLRAEFTKPYWAELRRFVADERACSTVYPAAHDEFAALHLTSFADTAASTAQKYDGFAEYAKENKMDQSDVGCFGEL